MPRTPLVVGNWKMHKTVAETVEFCRRLRRELGEGGNGVEVAIAPPFTSLAAAAGELRGSAVLLSAQNVFWEARGAYTGEISPVMLAEVGCRFVIVGHSERRQHFQESDRAVQRKAAAVLRAKMIPILCLGETLAERQEGSTFAVVERQMRQGAEGLTLSGPGNLVVAYEPVWAIGTGQVATPEQAQEVQAFLRRTLAEILSSSWAREVRILYGGSVKPENVGELAAMADVDGVLVGGASLEVPSFREIIEGCRR